jgi:hypothetical protein
MIAGYGKVSEGGGRGILDAIEWVDIGTVCVMK